VEVLAMGILAMGILAVAVLGEGLSRSRKSL